MHRTRIYILAVAFVISTMFSGCSKNAINEEIILSEEIFSESSEEADNSEESESASLEAETIKEQEEYNHQKEMLLKYVENDMKEVNNMMSTLDSSITNPNFDVVNDGGFALTYIEETVNPYIEKLKNEYADTEVEGLVNEFDNCVQEYSDAMNYLLSSTDELLKMQKRLDSGALANFFYYNWVGMDYVRIMNDRSNATQTELRLYYLHEWGFISENPIDIQDSKTTDEMFEIYKNGLIALYNSYGTDENLRKRIIVGFFGLSEYEYTNLAALVSGNVISQEEYDKKLLAIQTELKQKITKYQDDYGAYVNHLDEVANNYEIDVREYLE